MRDLGFDEVVGWSFTDPGEPARLRIAPATTARRRPIALSNPLSEDQSVMRTTVLGSLLDAARANLARGAERVALFESGRVYLPSTRRPSRGRPRARTASTRWRGSSPASGRRRSTSRTGSAAWSSAPLELGSWRARGAAGRLLRAQGRRSKALAAQLGAAVSFEPAEEPFLHPGRAAAGLRASAGGAARAGSASCTRWSAGSGTSRRRRGVRTRPRGAGRGGRVPARSSTRT